MRHHEHFWDFGGRGGPFGGGPRGGRRSWFGFGGAGPDGFDFRSGRKLSSADLQLMLLALIGERPRHGYDLIKAIDEKSGGFYVPSPGVIYPALTYLEEAGDAVAVAEGARKLYSLTDAGKATLTRRRAEADELLEQLDAVGKRMGRVREAFSGSGFEEEDSDVPRGPWSTHLDLATAIKDFHLALKHRVSGRQQAEIAAIIRRAAAAIRAVAESDDDR